MAQAILLMKWDERIGVDIIGQYPVEYSLNRKALMQLYSQHQYSQKAGFISLNSLGLNLASYYTGSESSLFIILVLDANDDPDAYEEVIVETVPQLITNKDPTEILPKLPDLFHLISGSNEFTEEQRCAILLSNPLHYAILKRLRNEIALQLPDIEQWLNEEFKFYYIDIDQIVSSLTKAGVAKIATVKELPAGILFFIGDMILTRKPPIQLLQHLSTSQLPEKFHAEYTARVKEIFTYYHPNEQDLFYILQRVLLNPDTYDIFELLRKNVVSHNILLEMEKNGEIGDSARVLENLLSLQIVTLFDDGNNNKYYCLLSDLFIRRFFPLNNLNLIVEIYKKNIQDPKLLLKALNLLKEEYYIQFGKKVKTKAESKPQFKSKGDKLIDTSLTVEQLIQEGKK